MKQKEVDGKTTVNNRHYILVGYYSNLSGNAQPLKCYSQYSTATYWQILVIFLVW